MSDWFGNGLEPTRAMHEWLDALGLTFTLASIEASAVLVVACGLTEGSLPRSGSTDICLEDGMT